MSFPDEDKYEVIGEVDPGEAYQFDTVAVWREKATGRVVWDMDSGCSCPSPFEDWEPKPLPETWADFERAVNENGDTAHNRHDLIEKVRALVAA